MAQAESHDVVLTGLDFKGGDTETGAPLYTRCAHLILHGDRIAITNDDISDPRGICISAGEAHATDPTIDDVAKTRGSRATASTTAAWTRA